MAVALAVDLTPSSGEKETFLDVSGELMEKKKKQTTQDVSRLGRGGGIVMEKELGSIPASACIAARRGPISGRISVSAARRRR